MRKGSNRRRWQPDSRENEKLRMPDANPDHCWDTIPQIDCCGRNAIPSKGAKERDPLAMPLRLRARSDCQSLRLAKRQQEELRLSETPALDLARKDSTPRTPDGKWLLAMGT